jgi:hypothetical protein
LAPAAARGGAAAAMQHDADEQADVLDADIYNERLDAVEECFQNTRQRNNIATAGYFIEIFPEECNVQDSWFMEVTTSKIVNGKLRGIWCKANSLTAETSKQNSTGLCLGTCQRLWRSIHFHRRVSRALTDPIFQRFSALTL